MSSANRAATPTTPTPAKKRTSIQDTPPIADRYVKTYVSPDSQVAVNDPWTFSLKPAAWHKWETARYGRFIDFLRGHVDLAPFAEEEGISVKEVNQLFTHIICDDIYAVAGGLQQRAEQRVAHHFKLLAKRGEPLRAWTVKSVNGELWQIRVGEIELIAADGSKFMLQRSQLSDRDLAHLKERATEQQWRVLHCEKEEPQSKKRKIDSVELE